MAVAPSIRLISFILLACRQWPKVVLVAQVALCVLRTLLVSICDQTWLHECQVLSILIMVLLELTPFSHHLSKSIISKSSATLVAPAIKASTNSQMVLRQQLHSKRNLGLWKWARSFLALSKESPKIISHKTRVELILVYKRDLPKKSVCCREPWRILRKYSLADQGPRWICLSLR